MPDLVRKKFQVAGIFIARRWRKAVQLKENFTNYWWHGRWNLKFGKVYEPYYFPDLHKRWKEQSSTFVSKLNYLELVHAVESGMKLLYPHHRLNMIILYQHQF